MLKVVHRNEFINIVLKNEEFFNTPVEDVLNMFGHIVHGCFHFGDERGFEILKEALRMVAERSMQILEEDRPEWEK